MGTGGRKAEGVGGSKFCVLSGVVLRYCLCYCFLASSIATAKKIWRAFVTLDMLTRIRLEFKSESSNSILS
jgi:hypothetical protein